MKNIPRKIFVLVLMAGVISIVGVSVLTFHIVTLTDQYRVITNEYFENMRDATDIRMLLYRHQALVANHVSAGSKEKYDEYEKQADAAKEKLNTLFVNFGKRMSGGEREQIFHNAYTGFYSYLQNAENALNFSRANQKEMADYYVVAVMENCVNTVNTTFDDLEDFTAKEIGEAKEQMDFHIRISVGTAVILIAVIVILVIFTSFYCFKIASAMDNEHTEKMLRLQNNIVMSMANLIESRDGDTGEHVKRTSVYVNMLAKEAQRAGYETEVLTDDYVELLTKAAPLHDIGKITISDTILLKPGKLTQEEFEKMKLHACNGGQIVNKIISGIEEQEYVDIAADIATYHHEKWDGSGYNQGISGGEIPLCARIMALADVFDALISKRCYKDAMSLDGAFAVIEESSGSHFDPTLAGLFVGLRPQIEKYLAEDN